MEDKSFNSCVSIKEVIYVLKKMNASLPAEEPQKYFLSFKNGFCWSVCNTAVGYIVKFCSFKLF